MCFKYKIIPGQQMKHRHVLEYKVLYHHVYRHVHCQHNDHLLKIIDKHVFCQQQLDYLPFENVEKFLLIWMKV